MYFPNGTNVYGSRDEDFEGIGSAQRVKKLKNHVLRGHFLFTCSDTFAVGCII